MVTRRQIDLLTKWCGWMPLTLAALLGGAGIAANAQESATRSATTVPAGVAPKLTFTQALDTGGRLFNGGLVQDRDGFQWHTTVRAPDGTETTTRRLEVKLRDDDGARRDLLKLHGLLRDRVEVTGADGGPPDARRPPSRPADVSHAPPAGRRLRLGRRLLGHPGRCRAQELDRPSFPSARPCERLPAGRGRKGGQHDQVGGESDRGVGKTQRGLNRRESVPASAVDRVATPGATPTAS
jgi:hypothetical protein